MQYCDRGRPGHSSGPEPDSDLLERSEIEHQSSMARVQEGVAERATTLAIIWAIRC
jgi:hypothetical protein